MGFIQRELERIGSALRDSPNANDYDRLYVAQQALAWATDPEGFKSPMRMIRGTQEATEDCLACLDPGRS